MKTLQEHLQDQLYKLEKSNKKLINFLIQKIKIKKETDPTFWKEIMATEIQIIEEYTMKPIEKLLKSKNK